MTPHANHFRTRINFHIQLEILYTHEWQPGLYRFALDAAMMSVKPA